MSRFTTVKSNSLVKSRASRSTLKADFASKRESTLSVELGQAEIKSQPIHKIYSPASPKSAFTDSLAANR